MSLKRSQAPGKSFGGGGGDGGSKGGSKIDRQDLFDELKRLSGTGDGFSPVDVALAIGSSEVLVSKAFLGLAIEGLLERLDAGRYRTAPLMAEVPQAEFVKTLARASNVDSARQRDLSEIGRLKHNNDTMRQRLLAAISERDHYLSVLRSHDIDPGPVPAPSAPRVPTEAASESATGPATPSAPAEAIVPRSDPGSANSPPDAA